MSDHLDDLKSIARSLTSIADTMTLLAERTKQNGQKLDLILEHLSPRAATSSQRFAGEFG